MSTNSAAGSSVATAPVSDSELNSGNEKSITVDEFKSAFRGHPGGVAVITADIGEGPVGLTATSVISTSVDPNILAFSVSEFSSSTPTLLKAKTVVIHLLGAGDVGIAKLCATSGIDRFADTSLWSRLPNGEPYFPSVPVWVRGQVISTMDAGRSNIIAVQALNASPYLSAGDFTSEPLVYHNRTWHELGSSSQIQA